MRILKVLFVFWGLIIFGESAKAQFWTSSAIPSADTIYSITLQKNDTIFIGTRSDGVHRSTDKGVSFAKMSGSIVGSLIDSQCVYDVKSNSLGYVFAGTRGGGVYRTTNNGQDWTNPLPLINAHTLFASPNNYVFVGTDNGEIYKSSNSGSTWQLIGSTNYFRITSFIQSGSNLFCGTMGGGIFRSTDNGDNWIQIVTTTPLINNVQSLLVNSRYEIFAATSNNGIYKSSDNGVTWNQVHYNSSYPNITSLIVNKNDDIFAGTYGNGILLSTDYGVTWSKTASVTDNIRSLGVDDSGSIYASANDVLYRSVRSSELSKPTLVRPANNSDTVSASPLMVWNRIDSADIYTLQISSINNFTNPEINKVSIVDTNYLVHGLDGLEYEKNYFWRVQASNSSATSNWSNIWTFKTVQASPDIPVLLLPLSNDTTVGSYPTFRWRSSPRAANYIFQLALDRDFTQMTEVDSSIIDTSYVFGPLTHHTKFFWRVRAKNIGWTSDWSRIDSFSTIIPVPSAPTPLNPSFGEINIPTAAAFRWTKSQHALTYRLQISSDPGFGSFFYNDSSLTDTSIVISSLANNTSYYWRVNAKNSAGTSDFSTIYHFTTIITVPNTPVLVLPTDTDSNYTTSPTFVWNKAIEAIQYQLQLSTTALFTTIINDTTWLSDTTTIVNSLLNGTTYYWRVRAKNAVGYSGWTASRSFKTFTNAAPPSWWNFTTNTGNNSSISIPLSVNPTIGGISIKNGDAIGVFFLRNDSMFCAGYTTWNYNVNNGIIIWGDNSQTPGKDGFAQNELIRFKIWDSKNRKEYPAQVKFLNGKTKYFMNEYLIVDSLKAATKIIHQIRLNQGWNMISTYAQPADSSMDSVCSGIRSSMVLLKDGFGKFYWPDLNIRQLPYFDFRLGYQIYMLAPTTLTITGMNVLWDTTKVKVIRGWNMISYLRQSPMRVDSALSRIIGKVVLVKNDSGQFFWNEFGINTIGTMKPGIGYQIYMSDSASFSYPYGLVPLNLLYKKQYAELKTPAKPAFYKSTYSSNINTAMAMFESPNLCDGDEVGIFTLSGSLVGSGVASEKKVFFTIFGDESLTKNIVEGAKENEELIIKIKKFGQTDEIILGNISVVNAISGEKANKLLFKTNSLLKIAENSIQSAIPTKYSLEQNYPNPFNPSTKIKFSLPIKAKVTLEIFNTLGQIVKREFENVEMPEGEHNVEFNASGFASGIYYYRLKTERYSETKKMLLLR